MFSTRRKGTIMQSQKILFFCLTLFGFAIPRFALAADEGAKTFKDVCSSCHTAKVRPLNNKHLTKEQWKQAVDKMIDLGVEVPKAKIPDLLDYLVSTQGPACAAGGNGKK